MYNTDAMFVASHNNHLNPNNMDELLTKIYAELGEFTLNVQKAEGGNKSAGRRARKATLNLEKLFKEFRNISIRKENGTVV